MNEAERVQKGRTRSAVGVMIGLGAGVIYMVGLIAPLTPSEGVPTLVDLVIFALLPIALMPVGTGVTKWAVVRAGLIAEAGGIVAFTLYLLRLQGAF